jgi:hypothetical protein
MLGKGGRFFALEGCNEPFGFIAAQRRSTKPYPVTADDDQSCCFFFHGSVTFTISTLGLSRCSDSKVVFLDPFKLEIKHFLFIKSKVIPYDMK